MPPIEFLADPTDAGKTVAEMLRKRFQLSWNQAKRLVEGGHVRIAGMGCQDPAQRIRRGNRVWIREGVIEFKPGLKRPSPTPAAGPTRNSPPGKTKPGQSPAGAKPLLPPLPLPAGLTLVYADEAIVVVDKPAGLTTMRHADEAAEFGARGQAYLPKTVQDWLPRLLGDPRARGYAVHRIDRDTSGLVVFARTPAAAQALTLQFRKHTVERTYWALVRGGAPQVRRIESWLVRDRGDGRRGSRSIHPTETPPEEARRAVTYVRVLATAATPAGAFAWVACQLETGRTHQVRIHLGEAGHPLCGERVYDRPLHGAPLPDRSGAARPLLHALRLGFLHPITKQRLGWDAAPPADFLLVRKQLGLEPSSEPAS